MTALDSPVTGEMRFYAWPVSMRALWGRGSASLVTAVIAVGLGECLHTTALTPLVADLAPAHLRGRYMAVIGLCFWIGLAVAPTGGTALLCVAPPAGCGVAGALARAAAFSMLRREPRLPEPPRLPPVPAASPARLGGRGAS